VNFIGTTASALEALGNTGAGVVIQGGGSNTVGVVPFAYERNVISGNSGDGVRITASHNNVLMGNFIGPGKSLTAELGNGGAGVLIEDGEGNQLGSSSYQAGNAMAHNGSNGVEIRGAPAVHNTLRGNFIYDNAGKGIENAAGGNIELEPPSVQATTTASASGTSLPGCVIDVFSDVADEGQRYEGTVIASDMGSWTFVGEIHSHNVTATCTDASGNTSEFSAPACKDDDDCDGRSNGLDNCPAVHNPGQEDINGDGKGDICEIMGSGNADCNEVIDSRDALALLRYSAGLDPAQDLPCRLIGELSNPTIYIMGDVNCSNTVNATDALLVLRYIARLPVVLPPGCPAIGPP
jgi:hypothetical protein